MSKFYAFVTSKEGKTEVVNFENMGVKAPKFLFQAEKLAKDYAKKNNLSFESAHVVKNSVPGGKTLTKFKKLRQQTGSNGKNFVKSL